jgi:hypothetical protein
MQDNRITCSLSIAGSGDNDSGLYSGWCLVKISAVTLTTVAEDFHASPPSLQSNSGTVSSNRPRPLPPKSVPLHDPLIMLQYDAIQPDLRKGLLRKP